MGLIVEDITITDVSPTIPTIAQHSVTRVCTEGSSSSTYEDDKCEHGDSPAI